MTAEKDRPLTSGGSKAQVERCYIGRYSTREQAERISARYGDTAYPNRTVEPEKVGGRTDWLIWCDR